MEQIILITDPGKDLDDEQALILAAGLHHAGKIELKAVVANLDPAIDRAMLARGTLDLLGLKNVPVAVGTDCFKGGENLKHETDIPYATSEGEFWEVGQTLLVDTLTAAEDKSITLVLNSGLTDAAELLMVFHDLFVQKVKAVSIMGGIKSCEEEGFSGRTIVPWTEYGPDKVAYLAPDDAANNAFDWPSALFFYQGLQEANVPMTIFMRHAAYAAQFPFSLYDKFKVTGNPIGECLAGRQKHAINALWKACQCPEGSPERGKLPMSRDRKWFTDVFCGGKDPNIGERPVTLHEDVWEWVNMYNQYDALNLVAAIPAIRDMLFDPVIHKVRNTQHFIVGIDPKKNGVNIPADVRKLVEELEVYALEMGVADVRLQTAQEKSQKCKEHLASLGIK